MKFMLKQKMVENDLIYMDIFYLNKCVIKYLPLVEICRIKSGRQKKRNFCSIVKICIFFNLLSFNSLKVILEIIVVIYFCLPV